ncbi:hypothetical protein AB1L88_13500 [Tautonia sp. JC769]|uniref:hypothetical protein n=1 Tax=Tautonia sp. JC769 TaxID=3232135 RepID=UPI00345767D8
MRLRFPIAAACGTGLMAFVLGPLVSATGQDEPRPEPRLELPGDQARPDRGGDREGPPVDRLQAELAELRRMLERERDARRQAEERLERSRGEEDRARRGEGYQGDPFGPGLRERTERVEREHVERVEREREREQDRDRERERERGDRRETPGIVAVAEAKVEAARAVLNVAELRLDVARRKSADADGPGGRQIMSDEQATILRLAVAEAEAAVAEARVRVLESEYNLGQVARAAEDSGEDAVVKVESEFRVDDALETAEQVIGIIRRFQAEGRPR